MKKKTFLYLNALKKDKDIHNMSLYKSYKRVFK